jgi:hypothetical protein
MKAVLSIFMILGTRRSFSSLYERLDCVLLASEEPCDVFVMVSWWLTGWMSWSCC